MQHPISITVINNQVGIPPSADGVMMIFAQMVAVGTFALNTPYLLTQLSDLEAYGVTAATDATNSTALHQHVSEFYAQAGAGALLWVYGISTATTFTTFAASAAFTAAVKFTGQANPLNRAKMLGFVYVVPTTLQTANDFNADVYPALTALQAAQVAHFNLGYPWSGILDGANMSSTITPETITSQAINSASSMSLCVTGTLGNGVSAVGLALGRFARITIGHGFGAVEDGAVNTATAYLTNSVLVQSTGVLIVGHVYTVFGGAITYNSVVYAVGAVFTAVTGHTTFTTSAAGYVMDNSSPVYNLTDTDVNSLGGAQLMFLRTWMNHSGYYWNDGATCCSPTLQLSTQEYNRVANSLSADARSFFIDEMGKNLPLDTKTGAVDSTYLNAKMAQFYNQYIAPLAVAQGGSGDLSDGELILTGPNFLATKTLIFQLQIVPTPILGSVTGTIVFTATLS